MRIAIVGAGAVGGYIAARMLEDGLDVTLLVREGRKAQLLANGLVVRSPQGDYTGHPKLLVAGEASEPFDLVIIACKAYGLQGALTSIRPYVDPRTALLPFLNGFKHMHDIAEAFPGQPLLGGVAHIETTLDESGAIVHLRPHFSFSYGRYADLSDERYEEIRSTLAFARVLTESEDIKRTLWEKYSFISGLSGLTTLFQATVGEIRDAGEGIAWFRRAFEEIAGIIRAAGGSIAENTIEHNTSIVERMFRGSTSSMLRDMQSGLPTEAAHLHGYLLELARQNRISAPLLEVIYQRLTIYEKSRG